MKSKITRYTIFIVLPLLSCCYTVIKEQKNSTIQKKSAVFPSNDFGYYLNQYEKLLADGVPREKALQIFKEISRIDDQGRLDVEIELVDYCSSFRDTVWAYNGILEYNPRILEYSYKLSPEAIRAISLIDCVRRIRRQIYGVTQ